MSATRHLQPRARTRSHSRLLVFAPSSAVMKWIEDELEGEPFGRQVAHTPQQIVCALIDDPPPRAQLLIADFDALTAGDVLGLHAIRERGWFGSVIGVGTVGPELRKSLTIERVLPRPLKGGVLRWAVAEVGLDRATSRIPKIPL
jgi:hypothetical protein